MPRDITRIIDGWEFDPDRISVRLIAGEDGREKIQLRLDLGLLQMEIDGRPDGQRPAGFESWLDYYRHEQAAHDAANPDAAPFTLSESDCERLLREGVQYYHRYLSFWHLERYELCARDTRRNLQLFRFVREHAKHERDRMRFDQWRPYVIMMHARAVATPFVELGDFPTAISAIDAGIREIRQFLEEYGQADKASECGELVQLEKWREEVVAKGPTRLPGPPPDALTGLRHRLADAVREERFEDAARLRDEIQRMSQPEGPPAAG
ncbi:MAG: UvrB/UvrC motif-containing protein [Planctomycetia bacterium]|nr:UvrB/UvrC motif-containing protein [Planctomycetia bacterium]